MERLREPVDPVQGDLLENLQQAFRRELLEEWDRPVHGPSGGEWSMTWTGSVGIIEPGPEGGMPRGNGSERTKE